MLYIYLIFVKKFIYEHIIPLIEKKEVDFFSDYKSILQELVQTNKKSVTYEVIGESGPAHNKTFEVVAKVEGIVFGKAKVCIHRRAGL